MRKKIGLFFGSFNPVHNGHLILAQYMAEHSDLDEVWLVLSPQNPLKERRSLAPDYDRLDLLEIALREHPKLRTCDIEFRLPKPSYTIDTLTYLGEQYPNFEFVLLLGADNIETLPRWKNYERLLASYAIYYYPRPGYQAPAEVLAQGRFSCVEGTPLMELSSTQIRQLLRQGKSIRYWVPEGVAKAIDSLGLYQD